jgi:SulP family sulfate permease
VAAGHARSLRADLLAGLTGALIVLPQGVAFATIAGLPPQYGLYAAMIPAVIGALFGSSWHLVSGPTTAISIAVFAALSHQAEPGTAQYINLVLTLTFLVGVFQLVLGLARMGALVNFISHTVVIGFTAGAAILIAASQVRSFFGIDIPRGTPFYEIIRQLVVQFANINPWVLAVGVATLATGILTKRHLKKLPYMIAAMVVGSIVAEVFNLWQGQDQTGIRTVGALPAQLPPLSMPDFSLDTLRHTLGPALVITMLALTEAVSISRAIAVRSEQRIDANQEFIGQGLSNIIGSFFSAYASSGSFNRSGVNYEAGARTPLASVFATVFLILVLLLVAPLAAYLPNAAMAGILFLVAWGLIDFDHIGHIWHTSKAESAILAATLIGTLFNLEAGIFIGVFLSLVMYLYRSSKPEVVPLVPAPEEGAYHFIRAKGRPECPQLRIVRINGSVYFGAASFVQQALQQIDEDNPQQKSVLIAAASLNTHRHRRRRDPGAGSAAAAAAGRRPVFLPPQPAQLRVPAPGRLHPRNRRGRLLPGDDRRHGGPLLDARPRRLPDLQGTHLQGPCTGKLLPDGFRRQRLMLATDGSEFSQAAAGHRHRAGESFGVTLDVMTSVPAAEEDEVARARLAVATRAALLAGVDTEEIVRHGKLPVREVIAAATAADANILIVGRRPPRGDLKERMVGDVAVQIIAQAHCHVLIAGWQSQMWSRRILLASDGSTDSDRVAEITAQIAKITRTPVTLIATVASAGLRARAEEDLALKAGRMRIEGIECATLVVEGPAEKAIAETATQLEADLVVTGYQQALGRGIPEQLIGRLGCAVLLVRSGAEAPQIGSAVARQA